MSNKTTGQYNAEFKESAVKLATESAKPVAETARELGINISTLHTWIKKYHQPKQVDKVVADEHVYDELKRLRKENARLKEEREILKKAATFFAKEAR